MSDLSKVKLLEEEFDDIFEDLIGKSEKNVQYVCFINDHSGSMKGNREQSRTNFNEYLTSIKKHAKEIQTIVSVIDFDDTIKVDTENVLAENVEPLNDYWIGGMTALHDAIGYGISTVRKLMDRDPRENKAALFFINTDGWENASSDYDYDSITKLIKEMEDTGKWTFTWVAEGLSKQEAHKLSGGLSAMSIGNTVSFDKSASGYKSGLHSTVRGVNAYYNARIEGATQVDNFFNDTTKVEDSTDDGKYKAKVEGMTGGGEHG
jgi:uncharacterized protein YegL